MAYNFNTDSDGISDEIKPIKSKVKRLTTDKYSQPAVIATALLFKNEIAKRIMFCDKINSNTIKNLIPGIHIHYFEVIYGIIEESICRPGEH